MGRLTRSIVGATWLLSVSASAWAHPGHGSTDPHHTAHLFEPLHLLAWLVPAAVTVLVVRAVLRRLH